MVGEGTAGGRSYSVSRSSSKTHLLPINTLILGVQILLQGTRFFQFFIYSPNIYSALTVCQALC